MAPRATCSQELLASTKLRRSADSRVLDQVAEVAPDFRTVL